MRTLATILERPAASFAGGRSGLLQRKSDRDSAPAFREPRFGYNFADIQVHPQSASSDILQREPKQPEAKKEDTPPTSGSGQTPATPAAASKPCPSFPAPGFEAVVSPRDKIDTRKPNGRADVHGGRVELDVGIGELLDLSYRSNAGPHPSQNPAPDFFGGLHWVQTSGGGGLRQPDPENGTGVLTAPEAKADVHLEVRTVTQQCKMAEVTLHVREPSGIKMEQKGDLQKDQTNKVTAGMFVHILILPADVSFSALRIQEGDAEMKGSGWWKFVTGAHHCRGKGKGKYAGDNECGLRDLVVIPARGTMVKGVDKISSGTSNWSKDWQNLKDPAEKKRLEDGYLGTYEDPYDGGYTWDIPWLYVIGQADPKQFTVVRMEAKCDKTGKATISKDASGPFSREFSDPQTQFIPPPAPSP